MEIQDTKISKLIKENQYIVSANYMVERKAHYHFTIKGNQPHWNYHEDRSRICVQPYSLR